MSEKFRVGTNNMLRTELSKKDVSFIEVAHYEAKAKVKIDARTVSGIILCRTGEYL